MAKKSASKFAIGKVKSGDDAKEWFLSVDSGTIQLAIASVLAAGCGLTFSVSRDGKTLCVTILDDGTKERAYCDNPDDLVALCETIELQGAPDDD